MIAKNGEIVKLINANAILTCLFPVSYNMGVAVGMGATGQSFSRFSTCAKTFSAVKPNFSSSVL
jgi:hypothetical protein